MSRLGAAARLDAAYDANSREAVGLSGALRSLQAQSYVGVLLAFAGLGFHLLRRFRNDRSGGAARAGWLARRTSMFRVASAVGAASLVILTAGAGLAQPGKQRGGALHPSPRLLRPRLFDQRAPLEGRVRATFLAWCLGRALVSYTQWPTDNHCSGHDSSGARLGPGTN